MVTGQAQEVINDALRRMEKLSAALTVAQQAQIAAQKAATEAAAAIDTVMKIQGDVVFLQNLLQQFAGMFGTMEATKSGPIEETPPELPPVRHDPDPRLPGRREPISMAGTARSLLGQEEEPPVDFRPTANGPTRRLAASPALASLSEAAGRMSTELIRHRSAILAEAATPAHSGGPEEEDAPPAGRQHPGASEDVNQYIGHFAGPYSLFVRFLHPEVITGGRGFARPGYAGLKQYKQDVTQIAGPVLVSEGWSTGFYRNATTGTRQLLMRLPSALVLVDNPMMPNNMPLVAFTQHGEVQWRQIRTLSVEELRLVHDEIKAEFGRLEDLDKQLPQTQA